MKHIVIISASLRGKSNSDALAKEFARGAEERGNSVQYISLKGKQIAFCRGCLTCQQTGTCAIDDDARAITEAMCKADVLVFATPVYYYGMAGQLKTLLDRANSLYASDYAFRSIYVLSASAEEGQEPAKGTVEGVKYSRTPAQVF